MKQKFTFCTKKYNAFEEKMYPNWYWIHVLHDAGVLQINERVIPSDRKAKLPEYNSLEILLDAKGSRTDNIRKINLVNYKILLGTLPDPNEENLWWLGDTLTVLTNMKYHLELFGEQENGNENYNHRHSKKEKAVITTASLSFHLMNDIYYRQH